MSDGVPVRAWDAPPDGRHPAGADDVRAGSAPFRVAVGRAGSVRALLWWRRSIVRDVVRGPARAGSGRAVDSRTLTLPVGLCS